MNAASHVIDASVHRIKASLLFHALEIGLARVLRRFVRNADDLSGDARDALSSRVRSRADGDREIEDPVSELYFGELLELLSSLDSVDAPIRGAARRITDFYQANDLAEVRNAIAHQNRAWKPHYLPIIEAICLQEDVTVTLALDEVAEAYARSESGQLQLPPADWLCRVQPPTIPNNLSDYLRATHFSIFVGRSEERKRLRRVLLSPRTNLVSIVGPGGIGKTAFVMKVLQDIAADRSLLTRFDRILFVTGKRSRLLHSGPVAQKPDFSSFEELERAIASALDCSTLQDCADAFRDLRLLLCIDNIEELVGSDSQALEDLQLQLPEPWLLLLTSRVAVPAQTTIPLSPLRVEDLTRLAIDRLANHGVTGPIAMQTAESLAAAASSPLALVLSVDSVAVGGADVRTSIRTAANLSAEFAFSTLMEVLRLPARRVLDVIHVSGEQADIDTTIELLQAKRDEVEQATSELRQANLVLPTGLEGSPPLRLTPQVHELLSRQSISDLSRDKLFKDWNLLQAEARRLPQTEEAGLPVSEARPAARVSLLRLAERVTRCAVLSRAEKLSLLDALREHEGNYGKSANTAWLMANLYSHLPDSTSEMYAQVERAYANAPELWATRLRLALLRSEQGDHRGAETLLHPLIEDIKLGRPLPPLRDLQIAFTKYFQARVFAEGDRVAAGYQHEPAMWASIVHDLESFNYKPLELHRRLSLAIALRRSVEREPIADIRARVLAKAVELVMSTFTEQSGVVPWWTGEILALLRQIALATKLDRTSAAQFSGAVRGLIDSWGLELTQRHVDGVDMAYALKDASAAADIEGRDQRTSELQASEDDPRQNTAGHTSRHTVQTSIYAPPAGREYCFAQDSLGQQYFVHRSATRGAQLDFAALRRGDRLIVVPETTTFSNRAIRAISAELVANRPDAL
jgi:hypothetical protein